MKIKDLLEILDFNSSTLFYITFFLPYRERVMTYFSGYINEIPNFLYEYVIDKVFIGKFITIRCK